MFILYRSMDKHCFVNNYEGLQTLLNKTCKIYTVVKKAAPCTQKTTQKQLVLTNATPLSLYSVPQINKLFVFQYERVV